MSCRQQLPPLAFAGHESCGHSAPYIGLESYGCSDQTDAWNGACCNQDTCPSESAGGGDAGSGGAIPCGGGEGQCLPTDLSRRTEAVTVECCDQPSENCQSGIPTTCNAGCAEVFLAFWDDCEATLGTAGDHVSDRTAQSCMLLVHLLH